MWKVQLLNSITPTQFNGNPADFPFFRDQVCTYLESELLTDSQRVEYLPISLRVKLCRSLREIEVALIMTS